MDFDDLLHEDGRTCSRSIPDRLRALPAHVPLRAGRRVPGHEPRPVPHRQPARRRARQPRRGRRRRPVDLLVARRRHPQHPRVRARPPRRQGHQARAELPLDHAHPRRGQRGGRQQPAAQGQEPVDGARRAAAGARRRGRRRARRGAVHRQRGAASCWRRAWAGEAAGPGAPPAPDDIAVLYRTNAQSRVLEEEFGRYAIAYQVDRRHAVLRARRGQGRARLPARHRQPGRRAAPAAHRQRAASGASAQTTHAAAAGARPRRSARRSGSVHRSGPPTCPASRRRRCASLGAFVRRREGLAGRGARDAVGGRARAPRARRERLRRRCCRAQNTLEAEGRIENLEELVGVAAEYDQRAERAQRSTASCRRSRSTPTSTPWPTRAS